MKIGDIVSGTFYRVGEPSQPRDVTAEDIIEFEEDELGNTLGDFRKDGSQKRVPEALKRRLSKVSARQVLWVTTNREDAERYGDEVDKFTLDRAQVIGMEDEGGVLLLIG